jgi:uncharacterized protein
MLASRREYFMTAPAAVPKAAASRVSTLAGRYQLVLFFAATFLASWTLWFLAAELGAARADDGNAILFLPGTVAPAVVALWLNARSKHPEPLGSRLVRWDVGARWYVFAIGYILVAKLMAAVLHRLITGYWPTFGDVPLLLLLLATLASTPVQAGEEIGWRGYALPQMANAIGLPAASLLLGLLWALWHLPLFYIHGTDLTGQPLGHFVLAVTALSVAMTWLHHRTGGSLLLVMLMHAAVNNTTGIVPSARLQQASPLELSAPLMAWLTVALLWTAAGYLLARLAAAEEREARNDRTA